LEMLAAVGYDRTHPAVAPALAFLKKEQEADGSWYGRWGVNYIYGTWSVLAGLRAIGEDLSAPYIRRAVSWLESKQNPDGGWGESCLSYAEAEHSGKGDSTPSQTAWALMGLMSAGAVDAFSVARGVQFLLRHQLKDGSWEEVRHTGTGFPRVFYLRYHWYCQYFPLWALATNCVTTFRWTGPTGLSVDRHGFCLSDPCVPSIGRRVTKADRNICRHILGDEGRGSCISSRDRAAHRRAAGAGMHGRFKGVLAGSNRRGAFQGKPGRGSVVCAPAVQSCSVDGICVRAYRG
jgi:hypothetical protein